MDQINTKKKSYKLINLIKKISYLNKTVKLKKKQISFSNYRK